MSETGKRGGRIDAVSRSSEIVEHVLMDIPIEERGAVYAVIRMPREETPETVSLTQAIAHKFGKEVALRAVKQVATLEEQLKISARDLQRLLVASIEKRSVTEGEASTRFSIPCIDDEADYFIQRLGLDPEVKIALIQAINDMESKKGAGEALGTREVAQFLEAVVVELRKSLEPKYWEAMVKNFFEKQTEDFDKVFDALEKAGLEPEEVNPDYVRWHRLNIEWVHRGRAWVHAEIARMIDQEVKAMALPPVETLVDFMNYLQTKISPKNWAKFMDALKISGTDKDGLTFTTNDQEELKEWKFQMERAAMFLNPANRQAVEIGPFLNPELAVILNQFHIDRATTPAQNVEEVQALRTTIDLLLRIKAERTSDVEFKRCVGQLVKEHGQDINSPMLPVITSMVGATRELEPTERGFITEELDRALIENM